VGSDTHSLLIRREVDMGYATGGHIGPNKPDKGLKNGSCNVTACQRAGANWYNHSTRAYYCRPCALELNRANSDYPQMFNCDHSLCTEEA
jgi:hypothetical protein